MKPKKLVYGVGLNDADYVVNKFEFYGYVDGKKKQKRIWTCHFYKTWTGVLERCYSDRFQKKNPAYRGCSVSDEWLTFSNFKAWMEKQDFEGKHLDKDILFEGNKVYSAGTCVFVSGSLNMFTTDSGAARGEWMIGVCWRKDAGKFRARCGNPFSGKYEHIGYFDSELEAHSAWRKRKLELAHELAAIQSDPRIAKALIARYSKPYVDKDLK